MSFMAIPQDVIDDIRDRTDIVELISSYIPLRRAGQNFKANCPFHNEKTASFVVSPQKQIYHCFGCGEGGGVIQFVMKQERVTFPEAMEILADRAGVALPRQQYNAGESLKTRIYEANKAASQFYINALTARKNVSAVKYLNDRGINNQTIETFGLGYAPKEGRKLADFLLSSGFDLALLQKAALVRTDRNGSISDMFRDRIIFPVYDIRGRVAGFGSRLLEDKPNAPKYLNTPETLAYHKGSILFGLYRSKEDVAGKDTCVVVEGNLDMIVPFQYGYHSIAASLGTALTVEQVRLLKRYTRNIILMYDGDNAGHKAAMRIIDMLIEEDMIVKVASLPDGSDPDSFVRKNGIEAFEKAVHQAKDFFDFKLDVLLKQTDMRDPHSKNSLIISMFDTLRRIESLVVRNEYIRRLSEIMRVPENIMQREFAKTLRNAGRTVNIDVPQAQAAEIKMPHHERYILQSLLIDTELVRQYRERLVNGSFEHPAVRDILNFIIELSSCDRGYGVQDVLGAVPEHLKSVLTEISVEDFELNMNVFIESLNKLKSTEKIERLNSIKKTISAAQREGADVPSELMLEFVQLRKELDSALKGECLI